MNLGMKHKGNRGVDQSGFASIVIALVLVLVMSLLTVAFSQLARREQKSALDKQLATQAYYAAESGVNDIIKNLDAVSALSNDPNTCLTNAELSHIGLTPTGNRGVSISASDNAVSYACVLVDANPDTLQYSGVGPEEQKSSAFSISDSLKAFTINWVSADQTKTTPRTAAETPKFSPKTSWNSPGVLQVSITPLTDMSRAGLIANTGTAFLYPGGSNPSTISYNDIKGTEKGAIVHGHCNYTGGKYPGYPCRATITDFNEPAGTKFLIRILNYYTASNILISDAINQANVPSDFVGAQAKIDVTGRAQDVLKRIQVRSPISEISRDFGFTIEGQSICKRTTTYPGRDSLDPPDLTAATSAACNPWVN